jgi:hypothetical protein
MAAASSVCGVESIKRYLVHPRTHDGMEGWIITNGKVSLLFEAFTQLIHEKGLSWESTAAYQVAVMKLHRLAVAINERQPARTQQESYSERPVQDPTCNSKDMKEYLEKYLDQSVFIERAESLIVNYGNIPDLLFVFEEMVREKDLKAGSEKYKILLKKVQGFIATMRVKQEPDRGRADQNPGVSGKSGQSPGVSERSGQSPGITSTLRRLDSPPNPELVFSEIIDQVFASTFRDPAQKGHLEKVIKFEAAYNSALRAKAAVGTAELKAYLKQRLEETHQMKLFSADRSCELIVPHSLGLDLERKETVPVIVKMGEQTLFVSHDPRGSTRVFPGKYQDEFIVIDRELQKIFPGKEGQKARMEALIMCFHQEVFGIIMTLANHFNLISDLFGDGSGDLLQPAFDTDHASFSKYLFSMNFTEREPGKVIFECSVTMPIVFLNGDHQVTARIDDFTFNIRATYNRSTEEWSFAPFRVLTI